MMEGEVVGTFSFGVALNANSEQEIGRRQSIPRVSTLPKLITLIEMREI